MLILRRYLYVSPSKFNLMAIIENMWLRKSRKRVAGAVLYQAMEQTRMRELAKSVTNPRTESQMGQRVKWSQLVNFYRVNSDWMKYAYETKKAAQSEYNKFMSLNVANSNVYFTKAQASAGSCVVLPYIMTQGSLPSIEFTANAGSWSSNIYLPEGTTLTSTTLVSNFSVALKQANPAIREGDQISFIRYTQMFNSETGSAYVIMRKYEFIVDSTNTDLVGSYLPLDYIGVLDLGNETLLGVIDSGLSGGFLMVLSRTIGGKTYVSSQTIIPVAMDSIIANFSTDAQKAEAIASYGESEDAFLSSTSANTNTQAISPLTIIGVEAEDVIEVPGNIVQMQQHFKASDVVTIKFNGNLTNVTSLIAILVTNKKAITLNSPTYEDNEVMGAITSGTLIESDEYLAYVSVRTGSGSYVAIFTVPPVQS